MIKLSSLRADVQREKDGDWVDIPELPGVALKVRGFAYGPFQIARDIVQARWVRKYQRDPVPPEVSYPENAKLYADHILLDWRGFDVPYSRETALETLLDPGFRDLHEHIRYAGGKLAQTETEFVEEAGGN